jgi:hypothetical protein
MNPYTLGVGITTNMKGKKRKMSTSYKMRIDYKLSRLERYFRDPVVGDSVLRRGMANEACRNIRIALKYLEYIKHNVPDIDEYDEQLEDAVKAFQEQENHIVHDGYVGPRTRKLLTKVVVDKFGDRQPFTLMKFPKGEAFPMVFLSYAHVDTKAALRLYEDLNEAGVNVWFDKESLLAGEKWKQAIRREIRKSRFFIALLSNASISKKGYVQSELKMAMEELDEYPSSDIFLIPVRLDDCIPTEYGLSDLRWVDLFPVWEDGLYQILHTLSVLD